MGCRSNIARADAELAPKRSREGGCIRKAQHPTWLSISPGTVQVELVAMKSSLLACLGVMSKIVSYHACQASNRRALGNCCVAK